MTLLNLFLSTTLSISLPHPTPVQIRRREAFKKYAAVVDRLYTDGELVSSL